MHPVTLLAIAAGGAIGAFCRYVIGRWAERVLGHKSFYGTLAVNVSGCFCVGLVLGAASQGDAATMTWRPLVADGFCGALTTFSSFSLEVVSALREGAVIRALLYVSVSMFLGFISVAIGVYLTQ